MSQQLDQFKILQNKEKFFKLPEEPQHLLSNQPTLNQQYNKLQSNKDLKKQLDFKIENLKIKSKSEYNLMEWNKLDFQTKQFTEMILKNPVLDMKFKYIDLNQSIFTNEDQNDMQFEYIPFAIKNKTDDWQHITDHFDPTRLLFDYEDVLYKIGEDDDGKKVKISMHDFIQYALSNNDDSPLYIFCHNFKDRVLKKKTDFWDNRNNSFIEEDELSMFKKYIYSKYQNKIDKYSKKGQYLDESYNNDNDKTNDSGEITNQDDIPSNNKDNQTDYDKKYKSKQNANNESGFVDLNKVDINEDKFKNNSQKFQIHDFKKKAKSNMLKQFQTIEPFAEQDQFSYLKNKRPPYRWFLFGPKRSGSGVHTDPISTSAWNTLVYGHKMWFMAHPSVTHDLIKGRSIKKELKALNIPVIDEPIFQFAYIVPRIIEQLEKLKINQQFFVQMPGETLFVPQGWWHAVLNLDDTIAQTQNMATDFSLYNNLKNMQYCKQNKFRNLKKLYKKHHEDTVDDTINESNHQNKLSIDDKTLNDQKTFQNQPNGLLNKLKSTMISGKYVLDKRKYMKLSLFERAKIVEEQMKQKNQNSDSFDTLSSNESDDTQEIKSDKFDSFVSNNEDQKIITQI